MPQSAKSSFRGKPLWRTAVSDYIKSLIPAICIVPMQVLKLAAASASALERPSLHQQVQRYLRTMPAGSLPDIGGCFTLCVTVD